MSLHVDSTAVQAYASNLQVARDKSAANKTVIIIIIIIIIFV